MRQVQPDQSVYFIEFGMVGYLTIITLLILLDSAHSSPTPLANPYFHSVRTGRASFPTTHDDPSPKKYFTASYSKPIANSTAVSCYVALSSFNIPFSLTLENSVSVSRLGCTSSTINITLLSISKNINVVSYIVISDDLYGSQNFMALSLETQSTNWGQNKPIIQQSKIFSFNKTADIKYLAFFQGFALRVIDEQRSDNQRGFAIVINQINATLVNYSIMSYGENIYSGKVAVLLIIYNKGFFSAQNSAYLSGNTKELSNLNETAIRIGLSIQIQIISSFIGLQQLHARGDIIFSVQADQTGQMSVHSNGGLNKFSVSYLILPEQIAATIYSTKQPNNLVSIRQLAGQSVSTTPTNNTTTDSSNITIIIGTIVCACVLLGLVLIGLCCCTKCCEQQKKQIEIQVEIPVNSSQTIELTKSELSLDKDSIKYQDCNYCSSNKVHLMTHCQHYLHLFCLKRRRPAVQSCPICDDLLTLRKITVFCRRCYQGYVLELAECLELNENLGVDKLCACSQELSKHSQHLQLDYAIGHIAKIVDA